MFTKTVLFQAVSGQSTRKAVMWQALEWLLVRVRGPGQRQEGWAQADRPLLGHHRLSKLKSVNYAW